MRDARANAQLFVTTGLAAPGQRAHYMFREADRRAPRYYNPEGPLRAAEPDPEALRTTALRTYGGELDDTTYALALVRARWAYRGNYDDFVADARDLALAVAPGAHAALESLAPSWEGTPEDLVAVANQVAAPPRATACSALVGLGRRFLWRLARASHPTACGGR